MSVSVDKDRAQDLLESEWDSVQNSSESEFIDDIIIRQKIREVFNASQKTYKYILFTNILAKAVNPNIHYRAMQAKSTLDGAYNARSLGHQVIVEWEKEHGERLGGSNEPFLNKPARDPEFDLGNAARNESAQERLYNLLNRLEEKVNGGELDPVDVLRQALYEFSRLEPQTLTFESISAISAYHLQEALRDFLEVSGGGERLAAVTAGTLQTYYEYAGTNDVRVDAEHANTPDEFSNSAGDVEVYREDELHRAIEVKDKPTTTSDIQHAISKGQEHELDEYHYLVGAGFRTAEKQQAINTAHNAPIELILLQPADLYSVLKFVGDEDRVNFLDYVKEFLNDMRATEDNKAAFEELVETLREDK